MLHEVVVSVSAGRAAMVMSDADVLAVSRRLEAGQRVGRHERVGGFAFTAGLAQTEA